MRPKIDSPIGKLEQEFVRLRITNMAEVDVGLFDFDFNTTFSVFVLNGKKNVYLRYGGRTDAGADVMLSAPGLQKAMERGLALHAGWKAGDLDLPPPPDPLPAQTYPNVREAAQKGNCIHCHQVAEGQAIEMISLETFDKKTMPWIYPDPAKLGLVIDPDDGILVAGADGAAAESGIAPGDTLQTVDGKRVHTFADVQRALHYLPLEEQALAVTTGRGEHRIELPRYWRVTDINRRSIGHRMIPFPEFWGKTLSAETKKDLGADPEGFATRVTKFWTNTHGEQAGLREDDVVIAVNGETKSPLAQNAMIYIRTHFETGDEIEVRYLRDGDAKTAKFTLRAKPW